MKNLIDLITAHLPLLKKKELIFIYQYIRAVIRNRI